MAKTPIARTRLTDSLELLAGPGGNVLVLHGPDGLLLVDTFVRPAWPQLKSTLDAIGGPIKTAIDTHWHFDHADNNASLHRAGAVLVAHAKTKVRLSEPHDLLGLHMDPEPADALPAETFTDARTLQRERRDPDAAVHTAGAHGHRHLGAVRQGQRAAPRRSVLQRHLPVHRRVDRRQHQRDGGGRGEGAGRGRRADADRARPRAARRSRRARALPRDAGGDPRSRSPR